MGDAGEVPRKCIRSSLLFQGGGFPVWLLVLVSTGFPSPWGRNTMAPGGRKGTEVGRQKSLDYSLFWKLTC